MRKVLIALMLLAGSMAFAQQTTKNVVVAWTDSTSSSVASYNVYRTTTPTAPCPTNVSGFAVVGNVASPATSFTDANLATGPVYCYVATSLSTNNVESVVSNLVTMDLTKPAPPTNVTATAH